MNESTLMPTRISGPRAWLGGPIRIKHATGRTASLCVVTVLVALYAG